MMAALTFCGIGGGKKRDKERWCSKEKRKVGFPFTGFAQSAGSSRKGEKKKEKKIEPMGYGPQRGKRRKCLFFLKDASPHSGEEELPERQILSGESRETMLGAQRREKIKHPFRREFFLFVGKRKKARLVI